MSIPVRTCVVTRQRHNKMDMVRMVYFNDYVKVDPIFRENGRGIYILPDVKVFDEGIEKHKIQSALKLNRPLEKVEILRLRDEFEKAVELRDKEAQAEHKEKVDELKAEEENKPTNI